MSIFAEILCKQFPYINFPSINRQSFYELNQCQNHNKIYYNAIKLIYNIYFLPLNKEYNNINNTKFGVFNTIILNNTNISIYEQQFFLSQFYQAQRTYSAFRKLSILYKYKKSKKFEFEFDLCFNKFSNLSKNIIITLF